MRLAAICLTTLSLLFLAGCNEVDRPDSPVCVLNTPARHILCYNLKTDYDDQGNLKPSAKPEVTQYADADAMLAALNKSVLTTATGWTNIKIYIRKLRGRVDSSLVDDGTAEEDEELDSVSGDAAK